MDEALSVLYLEALTGQPQAVMVNYAAHPVVAMLLPPVSADYPGALAASVEDGLDGAPCLFLNGACGNVNSSVRNDQFRRRVPHRTNAGSSGAGRDRPAEDAGSAPVRRKLRT